MSRVPPSMNRFLRKYPVRNHSSFVAPKIVPQFSEIPEDTILEPVEPTVSYPPPILIPPPEPEVEDNWALTPEQHAALHGED